SIETSQAEIVSPYDWSNGKWQRVLYGFGSFVQSGAMMVKELGPLKFHFNCNGCLDESIRVCDVVNMNGSWNFDWLLIVLPRGVVDRIRACNPPLKELGILTNAKRARRGMSPFPFCEQYGKFVECTIHAVRDCEFAHSNVMNEGMLSVDGGEWLTFFLKSYLVSLEKLDKLNHWACYTQTTKGWQLPDLRWVKVNVDGSVSTVISKAAIGGTVRDSNGKWLTGFAMVTGMVEVFQVEARTMVEGLKLSWMKGYKQVQINYDNALLIDTIRNGFASISNIREVQLIHEWCHKDWKIKFRHILRESN
ncbi:hypothetical protein Goari_018232, partial [Gossypium aridum]|nr:hypothetical protein [Gossypium aridum]